MTSFTDGSVGLYRHWVYSGGLRLLPYLSIDCSAVVVQKPDSTEVSSGAEHSYWPLALPKHVVAQGSWDGDVSDVVVV